MITPLDALGRKIEIGDILAGAQRTSTNAFLSFYRVVGFGERKIWNWKLHSDESVMTLKVNRLKVRGTSVWKGRVLRTLENLDRVVVVNDHPFAKNLESWPGPENKNGL